MKVISTAAVLFVYLALSQPKQGTQCSYQNPAAWHAPECGLNWVVRDSRRTTSIHIEHTPAYHTYSVWTIGMADYVLAYRDQDSDPSDIVVDFYRRDAGGYAALGTEELAAVPKEVRTVNLIPEAQPQLAFFASCGMLRCLTVIRLNNDRVEKLFDYAASEIRVHEGNRPFIQAISESAKSAENFEWYPKEERFRVTLKSTAKNRSKGSTN